MRIAVVTETFYPFKGGSARRYYEVFRRIVREGHDVVLFTTRLAEEWPEQENIDGIEVRRSPMVLRDFITSDGFRSVTRVLMYSAWILRQLRARDYDVIEANHCPIFPAKASWLKTRLSKTPLSVTFHEVWHSEWFRYAPWRGYAYVGIGLELLTAKLPDIAITVSELTARRLVNLLGVEEKKVKVVPNGVDLGLFERYAVERDMSKVIFVGRLNPHKKVEWLIEAFKLVARELPDMKLEIVGDGPLRASYEEYAKKSGIDGCVTFTGAVDDEELVRKLKGAAIYVLPSIREGQSITTLEAMAAGTPQIVVGVDSNGASELLAKSGSGIVVNPSPRAIAEAILTLCSDHDLWLKLQRNGYKFVRGYSWDDIASKHLMIYEELAR